MTCFANRVSAVLLASLLLPGAAQAADVACFEGTVHSVTATSTGPNSDEVFFNIVGSGGGDPPNTNRLFLIKDHPVAVGSGTAGVPAAPAALAAQVAIVAAAVGSGKIVAVQFEMPLQGAHRIANVIQYGVGCPAPLRKGG